MQNLKIKEVTESEFNEMTDIDKDTIIDIKDIGIFMKPQARIVLNKVIEPTIKKDGTLFYDGTHLYFIIGEESHVIV